MSSKGGISERNRILLLIAVVVMWLVGVCMVIPALTMNSSEYEGYKHIIVGILLTCPFELFVFYRWYKSGDE